MSLRARRYGDIDPSDEVHDEIRELAAKTRTAIVARQNMDTANVLGNLKMFGPSEGSREVLMREKHAAEMAMQSGIYVVYRNFSTGKDCARVGPAHRCFCTHTLADHSSPAGRGTGRRCTYCVCNMFQYIPNRPEEIGEGWLARRSNFSSSTWFAKCRCGHGHNEHLPNLSSYSSCRSCRCSSFDSAFLCVVCDKHWEEHGTVFETEDERRAAGRSVGSDFLPLADVDPEFSEIVFGDHTRPQPDSRGNQSITLLAHSANGGLKNIRLRIKEPIGKPGQKAQNCSKCGNKWAQGIQCPRCGHRHG